VKREAGRSATDNKNHMRRYCLPVLLLMALCLGLRARQEDYAGEIRAAQAEGRYGVAAGLYRKLIAAGTNSPEIRSNYGMMLQLAGKSREAVEQFRIALRANSNLVAANLFNGLAEVDLGQAKQAIPYLERASQLDEARPEPELALGKAYVALREFKNANQAYREATKRDGNSAEAWYGVGITDRSLAEEKLNHTTRRGEAHAPEAQALLDDAYNALKRAVELDPQSARVHLILGESLRDSGKLVEAIPEYESAIRLEPRMEAGYLGLATTYWKQGEWQDAMRPLRQALELSPRDAEAHAILADLLFRQNNAQGAAGQAAVALAGNPKLALPRVVMARIDLANKEPDKAAAELEQVSQLDPDGTYHYLLWRAYKLAKKPGLAQAALAEFHRLRDAVDKSGVNP
jgi:tetratricopeptide (TPR) repeat protein